MSTGSNAFTFRDKHRRSLFSWNDESSTVPLILYMHAMTQVLFIIRYNFHQEKVRKREEKYSSFCIYWKIRCCPVSNLILISLYCICQMILRISFLQHWFIYHYGPLAALKNKMQFLSFQKWQDSKIEKAVENNNDNFNGFFCI